MVETEFTLVRRGRTVRRAGCLGCALQGRRIADDRRGHRGDNVVGGRTSAAPQHQPAELMPVSQSIRRRSRWRAPLKAHLVISEDKHGRVRRRKMAGGRLPARHDRPLSYGPTRRSATGSRRAERRGRAALAASRRSPAAITSSSRSPARGRTAPSSSAGSRAREHDLALCRPLAARRARLDLRFRPAASFLTRSSARARSASSTSRRGPTTAAASPCRCFGTRRRTRSSATNRRKSSACSTAPSTASARRRATIIRAASSRRSTRSTTASIERSTTASIAPASPPRRRLTKRRSGSCSRRSTGSRRGSPASAFSCGQRLTEADWRLFTTLIRFDPVYFGHFKCNLREIRNYPALSRYLSELYHLPGIAETVDFFHIKHHYYESHRRINPTGHRAGSGRRSCCEGRGRKSKCSERAGCTSRAPSFGGCGASDSRAPRLLISLFKRFGRPNPSCPRACNGDLLRFCAELRPDEAILANSSQQMRRAIDKIEVKSGFVTKWSICGGAKSFVSLNPSRSGRQPAIMFIVQGLPPKSA